MKRILLVSPFPPNIGGVSVSSQRLYENLVEDGYIVDKFDVKYRNTKYNRYKIFVVIRFLCLPILIMSREKYDVIHFHVSGCVLRMCVLFFRPFFSNKTRFISTVHGEIKYLLNSFCGEICLRGFDSVICVKQGDKKVLEPYFKGEIQEISAFIKPILKPNSDKLLPVEINDFINLNGRKLITHTGFVVCSEKYYDLYGMKTMLLSFNKLISDGIDCKLLILLLGELNSDAEVSLYNEIIAMSKINEISENVLIHKVNNTELWPILKKTSVFVRPTKTDGDALSVREALSLGIPTIASNVVVRPVGTVLYDLDSINSLVSAIKSEICSEKIINSIKVDSFYDSICKMYKL